MQLNNCQTEKHNTAANFEINFTEMKDLMKYIKYFTVISMFSLNSSASGVIKWEQQPTHSYEINSIKKKKKFLRITKLLYHSLYKKKKKSKKGKGYLKDLSHKVKLF